jgi:hypothetical protein
MRAFEVHLNGKRLCVAGIGEDGVLTAIITYVARKDGNDLDLRVGGLVSRTGEHVDWSNQRLKTGDEIRLKIVKAASFDSPTRRRRPDAKEELASKKRYVRKVARELGWEVHTKRVKAKP